MQFKATDKTRLPTYIYSPKYAVVFVKRPYTLTISKLCGTKKHSSICSQTGNAAIKLQKPGGAVVVKINWSSSGKKNRCCLSVKYWFVFFFYAPWSRVTNMVYTFELENPYGRVVFNALTQPTQFFFCSLLNRGSGKRAIFWWSHLLIAKIYRSDDRLRWTRKIRSWVAFLEPGSHHDHVYASVYSFWGSGVFVCI